MANGISRNNITTYKPHNEVVIRFMEKYFVVMQQFSAKLTVSCFLFSPLKKGIKTDRRTNKEKKEKGTK